MLLQFQVYGTTTGAPRTIGLTSAKGEIQQVILLKTHVAFLCPVTDVSAYSSVLKDVYIFVFIRYELQELVHTIEHTKIDEHYVI
jgi:hypothetical protein